MFRETNSILQITIIELRYHLNDTILHIISHNAKHRKLYEKTPLSIFGLLNLLINFEFFLI